jgi:hypothetical protein
MDQNAGQAAVGSHLAEDDLLLAHAAMSPQPARARKLSIPWGGNAVGIQRLGVAIPLFQMSDQKLPQL